PSVLGQQRSAVDVDHISAVAEVGVLADADGEAVVNGNGLAGPAERIDAAQTELASAGDAGGGLVVLSSQTAEVRAVGDVDDGPVAEDGVAEVALSDGATGADEDLGVEHPVLVGDQPCAVVLGQQVVAELRTGASAGDA